MLSPARSPSRAPDPRVFAALGDATRLLLLDRLRGGQARSITALSEGTSLSRQAVTKHLAVLEGAGLVRDVRHGRERRFSLDPAPLALVADWSTRFRQDWEDRFDRLDAFLHADPPLEGSSE
jgi:DNA-binding transcriptional ArsR family regulator